jgi:hypothetical protein
MKENYFFRISNATALLVLIMMPKSPYASQVGEMHA